MTPDDDLATFLSGFHSVAVVAYFMVAAETGQWPPDRELTRQKAYDLFEHGLEPEKEPSPGAGT